MGPRAKRRLAIVGSLCLGVTAIVAAVVLLTRSSPSPGQAAATGFRLSEKDTDRVISGMSGRQVRRLLGQPAAKRGRCWEYRVAPDKRLTAKGVVQTVVGVCFFVGRVTNRTYRDYLRLRGKLVPLREPGTVTLG
jgi:hypothetical protein